MQIVTAVEKTGETARRNPEAFGGGQAVVQAVVEEVEGNLRRVD